jgi:hypothetical protein
MLRALLRWWFPPPTGRTLQERYPAAPGAYVTSYSSIDLPEEAFAAPRSIYPCPWCGTGGATLKSLVPDVAMVIACRHPNCRKISKVQDVTEIWGEETRLVDTTRWP